MKITITTDKGEVISVIENVQDFDPTDSEARTALFGLIQHSIKYGAKREAQAPGSPSKPSEA